MIENARSVAYSSGYRAPEHTAELRLIHSGMCTQCDQVIVGGGLRGDFLLQKFKHQRHRHGAGAVWNDNENAFAFQRKLRRCFGNEFSDLITSQILFGSAFAQRGHYYCEI